MSKKITILLIVFIFHLSPLFPTVLATPSCNASGITYTPNAFPPSPSDITLNFKINSANVLENLRGKEFRLSVTQRLWWDYQTKSTIVASDSFSLTVDHDIPVIRDSQSPGTHTAVLDVKDSKGIWQELCSGIVYTIGDPKTCVIDPRLDSRIPPDTRLTIRYSGKPGYRYGLYINDTNAGSGLAIATTENDGQGQFKDVKMPGKNGDTFNLIVGESSEASLRHCSKKITIDLSAPQPSPPGTGPVPTIAPGTTTGPEGQPVKPPGPPTVAGGQPCGVNDSGIKTAIGCIHTSPAEFAKDFLKFAIGIGGGLAFLMMLLGAFQMLTSAGNPDSLKAGQERLTSAVIGLLFVIFATLFLQIIGFDILELPGFSR